MTFFDVLLDEMHWSCNTNINDPVFPAKEVDLHCSDLINRHIQKHVKSMMDLSAAVHKESDLAKDTLGNEFRIESLEMEGYRMTIIIDRSSGFEFKLKTI